MMCLEIMNILITLTDMPTRVRLRMSPTLPIMTGSKTTLLTLEQIYLYQVGSDKA